MDYKCNAMKIVLNLRVWETTKTHPFLHTVTRTKSKCFMGNGKPGMAMYICTPSNWEAEARELRVQE
jgi:hypothetical protein